MDKDEEYELLFYTDEDTYRKAESMAKELGFKTVGEFAVHAMRRYIENSEKVE